MRRDPPAQGGATGEEPSVIQDKLTPRELDVLRWIARGKTAGEIATILGIGKRTVDEHAASAVGKLGAANRPHAVALAIQRGIIIPDDGATP
jgi:DNA-binding CsgD family transcriptional regulator